MKNILLSVALLLSGLPLWSQADQPTYGYHYQAVVRTGNTPNSPVAANQPVTLRFQIFNATNQKLYEETHDAVTDNFGRASAVVGTGAPVTGTFSALNWAGGKHFLQVRVKVGAGSEVPLGGKEEIVHQPLAKGSGDWKNVGDTILYNLNKNIGIGTTSPEAPLHVASGGVIITSSFSKYELVFSKDAQGNSDPIEIVSEGTQPIKFITNGYETMRVNPGSLQIAASNGNNEIIFHTLQGSDDPAEIVQAGNAPLKLATNNLARLVITGDGRIGLGTDNPQTKLQVEGAITAGSRIYPGFTGTEDGYSLLHFKNGTTAHGGIIRASQGNGDNGDAPLRYQALWHNFDGEVSVPVLTVRGNDRAHLLHTTDGLPLSARTVAVLDETHPGKIRPCTTAYDRKVVGVVSNTDPEAKFRPGIVHAQENTADGSPVAIDGTVEVLAIGPIAVGDYLTTSAVPGYAMKAKNKRKGYGAILGKAMTPLAKGEKGKVELWVERH